MARIWRELSIGNYQYNLSGKRMEYAVPMIDYALYPARRRLFQRPLTEVTTHRSRRSMEDHGLEQLKDALVKDYTTIPNANSISDKEIKEILLKGMVDIAQQLDFETE